MSDYLGNLVARTLSPAFGVRPRLPSRFEPPSFNPERNPSPASPDWEAKSPTETVARQTAGERAGQPEPGRPPTFSAGPRPHATARARALPAREPAGETLNDGSESEGVVQPRPTPRAKATGEPQEGEDDSATGRETPPRLSIPTLPATTLPAGQKQSASTPPPRWVEPALPAALETVLLTTAVAPAGPAPGRPRAGQATGAPGLAKDAAREIEPSLKPAPRPLAAKPAITPAPAATVRIEAPAARTLAPKPAVAPASVTPSPAGGLRIETPAIRPTPTARAPRFGPPISLPTAKEPPPTINVTIGRIEVRATSASVPPARKSVAPAPAMKLEEYLRQRSAGGAR
jgi:hypothetical protein